MDIRGVGMVSVYAVDFEATLSFYRDVLGLSDVQPMGPQAAYVRFGRGVDGQPLGMYLIGGRTPPSGMQEAAHTTFAFDVPSAKAAHASLKARGVRLEPADEAMAMGEGWFWFTAFDPSGLPIEFLGHDEP